MPVVLRLTDGNGTQIIVGSADNPALIKVIAEVPATASGRNAYQFEVKHENPRPAYFSV